MAETNNNTAPKGKQQKEVKSSKIDVNSLVLPEYVAHRIKIWEEEKKRQEEAKKGKTL
jgi:hypothetical protein